MLTNNYSATVFDYEWNIKMLPYSWFHYGATFEDSERRLRDHKVNGAFLVREQPDNKFRLVFRCAGAVSSNYIVFRCLIYVHVVI